jgi:hypothetical protein
MRFSRLTVLVPPYSVLSRSDTSSKRVWAGEAARAKDSEAVAASASIRLGMIHPLCRFEVGRRCAAPYMGENLLLHNSAI